MKRLIPLAAAALAAVALLLFHPAAAPGGFSPSRAPSHRTEPPATAASATGWSTAPPLGEPHATRSPAAVAVVYVAGAVRHPGVYTVPAGARVGDALARAGGGRPDADLVAVNLAARLRDGDEIAVPVLGADPPARAGASAAGRGGHGRARYGERRPHRGPRSARRPHGDDAPPPDVVDLNAADERTLQTLPGVGAALAARIVLFRAANGPFGSVDELLDVAGITERRLELISPYVEAR